MKRTGDRSFVGIGAAACLVVALTLVVAQARFAAGQEPSAPEAEFGRHVAPLLETHCHKCHSGDSPEAELSLDRLAKSGPSLASLDAWRSVAKMLRSGQMPPEGETQPTSQAREQAVSALESQLATFDCRQFHEPGLVTMRRLNRVEYNNTIRDLLGVDIRPADAFPADDIGAGFDNIGDVLTISPVLAEKYIDAAESVVARAFADPDVRSRLAPERIRNDNPESTSRAMRRNISAFATRAFRRPAAEEEVDRLAALMDGLRQNGASSEEALQAGYVAVLASPHFLFRVELDPPAAQDTPDGAERAASRPLTGYELASRLSYFLWASMPDESLFQAAADGELQRPEALSQHVERMLNDPKAQSLVVDFAGQWLGLRELAAASPDPARFPSFDESLRSDMRKETELFVESLLKNNGDILDFLDADYTFLNERLARHYGVTGVTGDAFRKFAWGEAGAAGGQRRGVLTHASILLLTSNPTRTSPVKRGKWVLENILGEPPPPPPPGVEELAEDGELLGTLRERMQQHREDPTCAVCHRQMDTLGFGLENFDAVGAWRQSDGRFPIDASGVLPGDLAFNGPAELMQLLRDQRSEEFCRCLAEKMLTYALGRGLTSADRCAIDLIVEQTVADGRKFRSLVQAIVASEPFRLRDLSGDE